MKPEERLERELAKAEDAIFRQNISLIRLTRQPRTQPALDAIRTRTERRRALVRKYQSEGKSIAQTAILMGLKERTISRLRNTKS